MNTEYGYPNIDLWENIPIAGSNAIETLVRQLGELPEARGDIDSHPAYQADRKTIKLSPSYHYKAGCIDEPDTIKDLTSRGLHYKSMELGATRWIVIVPTDVYEKQNEKLPLLLVFHKEDYNDPYWAMKTLEKYRAYNDRAAENKDRTIIYIVSNNAPANTFSGIITEGLQNYCGDKKRLYIDLSGLKENQVTLKQIESFIYTTEDGADSMDPDSSIEMFDGIPVLNFCGRWAAPWRPHPLEASGDGTVNREWIMHSELGRKILEARLFASGYKSPKDTRVLTYWREMGLDYTARAVFGERWIIFTPAKTSLKKLPVVVCLHEINEPDDHGIIVAFATYRGFCEIAAQGDCAVIFFAMESPALNDMIVDILKDASCAYPIDLSRVYITGHSHNGHFAQEFARRNPNIIACVAPYGNSPGLPNPEVSHEAVKVDDERAVKMENTDMPTCIICGCKEVGCLVPVNKAGHSSEPGINVEGYASSAEGKIAMWNRRLKAERCPQQSVEDVMAAAGSSDKATRALGFPSDHTETIYIDGFEHYIADIKNVDGRYHFRVVAIENMPHMVGPTMHQVAWNYMRRFARNLETGEVVEM